MRLAMSLVVGILAAATPSFAHDDPLLQPIAPDFAKRWLKPQPPVRIFGNTYLVGFGGLNVALIQTKDGLILIDGAVPQAVPEIEENIRKLGFALTDIKFILSTEPHYDHAGGIAALARDTGATVVASTPAAKALEAGRTGPDDPQAAWLVPFPAIQKVRAVRDGEKIRLGSTTVTAVATPGHTAGSMSWTWRSCEGKRCVNVVFGSSLNPVSADGYRFSAPENRAVIDGFQQSFEKMRKMPCDILLSAHPDQSGGDVKMARLLDKSEPNPFIDPQACRAYADKHAKLLDARLERKKNSTEK